MLSPSGYDSEFEPGESPGAGGAEEALADIATGDPSTAAPVTPKGVLPRDEKAEAIMLSPSGYDSEFEPGESPGAGGAEEAFADIATGDPSTAAPVTPKGALPRDEK